MNDLISREAACQQMDNLFEEDLEAYGVPIPECFDAGRAIAALMGLPSGGRTMNKLKPCPFCGAPYPYITFEHGYIDDSAVVFCNACKISVKLEENDQEGFNDVTKEKAIEAWNKRSNNGTEIFEHTRED